MRHNRPLTRYDIADMPIGHSGEASPAVYCTNSYFTATSIQNVLCGYACSVVGTQTAWYFIGSPLPFFQTQELSDDFQTIHGYKLRYLLQTTHRRNHHQCLLNRGCEPGRYGDLPTQCSRLPECDLDWWMGPWEFRRILCNLRVRSSKCTRDQQTPVLS